MAIEEGNKGSASTRPGAAADRASGRRGRALSRRRFLGVAAGSLAGGALVAPTAAGQRPGVRTPSAAGGRPRARNVIFMIADGMSMGTLTLASMMHERAHGRPCHWCSLWSDPAARRALVRTESADSLVTDSAAAGSAWSIGQRVNNGALNITPDGRQMQPILARLHERGVRTGSVTTTSLTDATPASFMAVAPSRRMFDTIARQIAQGPYDVVLGGGAEHFPSELTDAPNLHVVTTAQQLRQTPGSLPPQARLMGLFAGGHTPYELDRPDSVPDLATMTWVAIDRLHRLSHQADGGQGGFFLQVEGGRVDHAAHANDACAMLHDMLAFDRAVGIALRYARKSNDTLVVVTTDHGNANPGLTVYNKAASDGLARIENARRSFAWIFDELRQRTGEPDITLARIVREAIGVQLEQEHARWAADSIFDRVRRDGFDQRNNASSVLGSVLANHLGVSFLSKNHTSDMVEAVAFGPGSEALPPLVHITDLHGLVTSAQAVANL
ncbi:MAG: alkaline phosphatase [Phycisphaerales bacterium]|nr:MAG: alkaline phosphatase [Phycisphaerales bacterium]